MLDNLFVCSLYLATTLFGLPTVSKLHSSKMANDSCLEHSDFRVFNEPIRRILRIVWQKFPRTSLFGHLEIPRDTCPVEICPFRSLS